MFRSLTPSLAGSPWRQPACRLVLLALLLLAGLLPRSAAAQTPPANDLCANAQALTPTTTCGGTSGTVFNATDSGIPAQTGTADDDVWYTFVPTRTQHHIIVTPTNAAGDLVAEVFSGPACPGSTDAPLFSEDNPDLTASNLTVGQTYYVRVYSFNSTPTTAATGAFTVCLDNPPAPPANDLCTNDQAIVPASPLNPTTGTVAGATGSALAANTNGVADDDVWYSFVATRTQHHVVVTPTGGGDMVHELFGTSFFNPGGRCPANTAVPLFASDPRDMLATGLSIGSTYLVRVYSYGPAAPTPANGTFTITVDDPTPPPANDDCAAAIGLPVNATCVPTAGTIAGATQSITPLPGGERGIGDDDVWYSFVATGPLAGITLTPYLNTFTDFVINLRAGACNGTSLRFGDDNRANNFRGDSISARNLTVGQTYYVRVYSFTGATFTGVSGTFELCVTSPSACDAPTALAASSLTATSADLGWTSGANPASSRLEYGPTGFAPGTGTVLANAGNPQFVGGLTAGTTYQFYVTQTCTSGLSSTRSGPASFTTPAAPLVCAAPTSLSAGSLTASSASLGWTNGANQASSRLEYGPTGFAPGTGTVVVVSNNPWIINGLSASTAYQFYVTQTCNNTGTSARVGPASFTTTAAPLVCAAPTALAAGSLTATSASLSWTNGASQASTRLEYGPTGFALGTGTVVNNASNPRVITGLNASTTYEFYVSQTCVNTATSATSGPVSFTTSAAPLPCAAPTNFSAAAYITATGVDLTWANGANPAGFALEYGPAGFALGTGTPAAANAGSTSIVLSALTPNTSYDVYIRQTCTNTGVSSWTGPVRFQTLAPPANDHCTAAISLPVNTTCVPTAGTVAGATQSITPLPSGDVGTADDDVWYSFVATSPLAGITVTHPVTATDFVVNLRSGTCNGTSLRYGDDNTGNGRGGDSISVRNLTVGQTYYVRVYSYNNRALTVSESPFNICITTPGPCAAPTALTAGNLTTTSALLNWGPGANPASSRVEYGPTGFAPGTGTVLTVSGNNASISGLTPATAYQYYVTQTCTSGLSSTRSGPASFTTAPLTCAPPTGLSASNLTTNSASLSWTNGASQASTRLEYGRAGFVPGTGTVVANASSPQAVSGLLDGTTYQFYVTQTCVNGATSTAVGPQNFTTLAAPLTCAAPTGLSAGSLTASSASLSWTNGADQASTRLEYGPTGFAPGTGTVVTNATNPQAISGLNAGTAYQFYVTQTCVNGATSATSGPASFTTTAAPLTCAAPTGLSVGSLTATSAVVSWTNGPNLASITLEYGPTGFTPGTGVGIGNPGSPWTLVGLNASTTYQVYVRQTCTNNVVSTAGPVSFTTLAAPLNNLTVSTVLTISGTYDNVTVTGTGVATLGADLVVNQSLNVAPGGVLASNCHRVTGNGSFTLNAGAELRICDAAGIAATGATGSIRSTGTRTFDTDASYTYNGTVAQTSGNGLPATVRELTVANASGLTLNNGGASIRRVLRLRSGNLSLNNATQPLILLSSASGTALIDNTGGQVQGGPIQAQRYIEASLNAGLGYRHLSSPVAGAPVTQLGSGGSPIIANVAYNAATPAVRPTIVPYPTVFRYDERQVPAGGSTAAAFDQGWLTTAGTSVGIDPLQGLTVQVGGGQTLTFEGSPQSGDLSVGGLTYSSAGTQTGWHLLGNPYPSPLDWRTLSVGTANTDNLQRMSGAVYVFRSSGQYAGSYRSFQNGFGGDPLIASGQAFFVRAATVGQSGNFRLSNANRVTDWTAANSTLYRGTADPRPHLVLALASPNAPADETTVYFEAGATPGVDARFDATKLRNPGAVSLFALAGADELAINGLPLLGTAQVVVPLGFTLAAAGPCTFAVNALANVPPTTAVWLRDAQTGTLTDLRRQPSYAFVATAGSLGSRSRFALVFGPNGALAAASALDAAQVALFPNPARRETTLQVPALPGVKTVSLQLVNALGQVVQARSLPLPATGLDTRLDLHGLPTGVYSLRLTAAGIAPITKRLTVE